MRLQNLKQKFLIIILLIIMLNSCATKEIFYKNKNECFHLIHYYWDQLDIEIEKVNPRQNKLNENTNLAKKVNFEEISYYLGKICIQNDEIVFYKEMGSDKEDLLKYSSTFIQAIYLKEIESFIKDTKENPSEYLDFYEYKKNGKLSQYITKKYNTLPSQIIATGVGEKYYKNGWSKSRNKELEEARINYIYESFPNK